MFEPRHRCASSALLSVLHLLRVQTGTVSSSILRALFRLCSDPLRGHCRGHCIQDLIIAIKRKHANGRKRLQAKMPRCWVRRYEPALSMSSVRTTSKEHVTVHDIVRSRHDHTLFSIC
ncbi:hypothetical protein BDZ85DRAFT_262764 [Elsinoe ampelina]|uniref:Secreted protein n=1 Tax=Elsinoe ampelina TaxID=302913 RepID=A0A6A6GBQ6_9PEZI|nr:hypothetical protein BDZ85DRAFT_262764 [Elsinoe ampelina]